MLRRFVSAAAVLVLLVGFVFAGEYNGLITEHKDGKITIKIGKKGEEPTEKTFKVKKEVKISKKGKDGDEEVKVNDFKEMLEKASKGKGKGIRAKIETDGEGDKETVTKITFGGARKKKDN